MEACTAQDYSNNFMLCGTKHPISWSFISTWECTFSLLLAFSSSFLCTVLDIFSLSQKATIIFHSQRKGMFNSLERRGPGTGNSRNIYHFQAMSVPTGQTVTLLAFQGCLKNQIKEVLICLKSLFSLHSLVYMDTEMATHSSILAWSIPRTEEPGGLQSMWSQQVGHD